MMEELTKRNGNGVWLREIEKALKRFNASLEWFVERIAMRDEEMETIRRNGQLEECEKNDILRAKRMKSISDVLEEVEILIDSHFFNEFSKKSSTFLKKVLENRNVIDARLFRRDTEDHELHSKDNEKYQRDLRKPPMCWENERG